MNLEDYIKDLDPELQDKARACGSVEELVALAKEAKAPLPDEALAAIAGGDGYESGNCTGITCPKCQSENVRVIGIEQGAYSPTFHMECNDCGHKWDETAFQ